MKAYGYVFVVLVLSTVAANAGQTSQGQAPKNRAPSVSSKTTQGGQTTQARRPRTEGCPVHRAKRRGKGLGVARAVQA
jgi:hypothetical protein